ncbi:MAG TPA: glycosyltransferase family 39 protein [Thermoguttaceae bacterium]|nr:glycosyltransferase family 39 protein [Thermoguttaceae bacterium]
MPQGLRHQLWIVAAAAVIFFTNLGSTALWDEDEPLYASCAREMLQCGDWVVPTFNGELFPEKPPLVYWLMMAGYKLFGVTEFAARFWSALLGVGTALVTYHLGKRLFSADVGFWAGLIVASSIIFTVSARAATLDSALVFVTTLAILVFVAGGMTKRGGIEKKNVAATAVVTDSAGLVPDSWLVFVLFYALLGVSVLIKGPIGVALPVILIGVFLLVANHRRQADVRAAENRGRHWTRKLIGSVRIFAPRNVLRVAWQMRPITAVVVVAAVALPWYVLVGLRTDGEFLREFFGVQNLGRALKPLQGHSGPFFYYIPAIFIGFFPWSVFLGPALIEAVRRIRRRGAGATEILFAVCWLAVFVGLWSIPSTKLPHYVLTAYPALALLTAVFVHAWIAEPVRSRIARVRMRRANVTVIVVGVGIMVALPIVTAIYLPGQWMLGLVGLVLVIGGVWVWVLAERGKAQRAMAAFALTAVAFLTAMFGFAALRVDRYQNAPVLLAEIRGDAGGDCQLAAYRFFRESLVFYADRHLTKYSQADRLAEFLDEAEHPYVVTLDAYEKELQERFPGEFRVLLRRPRFLRPGEVVVLARSKDEQPLHTAAGRNAPRLQ